jgi:hypothetical protein
MSIQNLIHGAATIASVFTSPVLVLRHRYQPALSAQEALQGDWKRVGADMWKGVELVKNERQIKESR